MALPPEAAPGRWRYRFGNAHIDLWRDADSGTIYESDNDTAMSWFGNRYIYIISKKQQGRFNQYLKRIDIFKDDVNCSYII